LEQEKLWVAQVLNGDQRAFARLVDAYQAPVYNLCYRMLGNALRAEDAAQETFVRVYTHLSGYDPEQKLSSWILATASHYCIDRLRRRRINWLSLDQVSQTRPVSGKGPPAEDRILEHEAREEVRRLLQSLPPDHRLVIVLRYWQDLSYAEIAQVIGDSESAIKSRLHRARRMLADQGMPATLAQGQVAPRERVKNHAML